MKQDMKIYWIALVLTVAVCAGLILYSHRPPAFRAEEPGGAQENGDRENRMTACPVKGGRYSDNLVPDKRINGSPDSRGFDLGLQKDNAQSVRGSTSNREAGSPITDQPYALGWETSLKKVFREPEKFSGSFKGPMHISMAANEYESVQLVLINGDRPLKGVQVEVSQLEQDDGKALIAQENVQVRVVGFVKTEKPDYFVPYVGYWPDPLISEEKFAVAKDTVQPVFITVYAPAGTAAGIYKAEVSVSVEGMPAKKTELIVKVWDFSLPVKPDLCTAFDFYDNRLHSGYQEFEKDGYAKWKDDMDGLKELYMIDMLRHRISPILNMDPLDISFDKKMPRYLKEGLSAFAIGRYGGSFDNRWPDDEQALYEVQQKFAKYAQVLNGINLPAKAYIYTYDEPEFGNEKVSEVAAMIHSADPGLKNMVCMNRLPDIERDPQWIKDIDIMCVRNVAIEQEDLNALKKYNKEIWMYVSGPSHPFPTYVIDYESIAYRILPWMAWKYDITGLLYWCVNFWRVNPWEHTINTKWRQNGNGLLYYPGEDGPVSTVRLEVIRDSIDDYDYLSILKALVEKAESDSDFMLKYKSRVAYARGLLNIGPDIVRSMDVYTKDEHRLLERRKNIAQAIEELRRLF